jgi:hypothetical protein
MLFCNCKHGLWSRGASRGGTSASTCKTFSSRVIHKKFSADNLFKAKYNNFCKKNAEWGIYFSFIGNIKDPRSNSHDQSQSIPQIFKTVVVLSVITKTSLGTPSASTAIHNV